MAKKVFNIWLADNGAWLGEFIGDDDYPGGAMNQALDAASREQTRRDVRNGYGDAVLNPLRSEFLREATDDDLGENLSSAGIF